jgi:hypothetical protein
MLIISVSPEACYNTHCSKKNLIFFAVDAFADAGKLSSVCERDAVGEVLMGFLDARLKAIEQIHAFSGYSSDRQSAVFFRAAPFDESLLGEPVNDSRDIRRFFKHSTGYLASRVSFGSAFQNAQHVVLRMSDSFFGAGAIQSLANVIRGYEQVQYGFLRRAFEPRLHYTLLKRLSHTPAFIP